MGPLVVPVGIRGSRLRVEVSGFLLRRLRVFLRLRLRVSSICLCGSRWAWPLRSGFWGERAHGRVSGGLGGFRGFTWKLKRFLARVDG